MTTQPTPADTQQRPQRSKALRRLAAATATLGLLAGTAIAVAAPSYAAGTYRTTATLRVHSSPGTSATTIGTVAAGTTFTLNCQWQNSSNIGGNATWDQATFSNGLTGAIADYYTSTPTWNNYAPGTGACGAAAPPQASGSLGGVDMQRACNTQYPGRGLHAVATNANSAYSWQCTGNGTYGINVNLECATQYGYGAAAALTNPNSAWSWYCRWNITGQMQAAVNWAVAEKNSPNPAWSDHYGHYWSGWCEEFAEQAEGFRFRYASALSNYQAEHNAGRIHSDTNPPAGALVFYGGGGGYGHVAVSVGGGQEIGTVGSYGQRYDVAQYPVIGYLSNPYYGWAYPVGS